MHVKCHQATRNVRAAFLELQQVYEGSNTQQAIVQQVMDTIHNMYYTKDLSNFNFVNYCNRHMRANNNLAKQGDKFRINPTSQVTNILKGIKRADFQNTKNSIIGNPTTRSNLFAAITKFQSQVQTLLGYNPGIANEKIGDKRIIGAGSSQNRKPSGYGGRNSY